MARPSLRFQPGRPHESPRLFPLPQLLLFFLYALLLTIAPLLLLSPVSSLLLLPALLSFVPVLGLLYPALNQGLAIQGRDGRQVLSLMALDSTVYPLLLLVLSEPYPGPGALLLSLEFEPGVPEIVAAGVSQPDRACRVGRDIARIGVADQAAAGQPDSAEQKASDR